MVAALVLLGAVCFTLVAAYQWTMFAARDWQTRLMKRRLLCAHRERPRRRRAAEQGDEVAAPQVGHEPSSRLGVTTIRTPQPATAWQGGLGGSSHLPRLFW
jgi:hypothetical protein